MDIDDYVSKLSSLKPGKQFSIPKTTPYRYITGIPALNLPAPEGTSGDWHFSTAFYDPTESDEHMEVELAGDGGIINTSHIYGQYGIYECSTTLKKMGLVLTVKTVRHMPPTTIERFSICCTGHLPITTE